MMAIVLSHLLPLGFVFAGLWDGRDLLVIFWIESLIIFFYAMLRLTMKIDWSTWEDFVSTAIWIAILVYAWAGFGSVFRQQLRIAEGPSTFMWGEVLTLLNYSLVRNGWMVVLVLFAAHGFEEARRYRLTKGYRTIPKDIGWATVKHLFSLFLFMIAGGFLASLAGSSKAMSIVIAVLLVVIRIIVEFWLGNSVPASDSPLEEPTESDVP